MTRPQERIERFVSQSKDFFPFRDRTILDALNNVLSSNNEVEASFGYFTKENRFQPTAVPEEVSRLILYLKNSGIKPKTLYSFEYRKSDERLVISEGKESYQIKRKLSTIDIPHWGYRISEALEEELAPEKASVSKKNYDATRSKNRTTFIKELGKDFGVSVDITFVETITNDRKNSGYEVEIERIGKISANDYIKEIQNIYLILQGGYEIISSKERFVMEKRFNSFFKKDFEGKQEPRNRFYSGFENKPRNFKLDDLLREPLQEYAITDKLDGIRKFLFIDEQGIYLINPPNGIIKVSNRSIQKLANTVIDGEYIDEILNIKNNTFHSFDILFFNGKDIRNLSFSERLKYLYQVNESYSGILKFYVKKFFDNPKDDFYTKINKTISLIETQKNKGYENDGIILQPINDVYAQKENIGRKMKKISTTLKWKPANLLTIDFFIKPTDKKGLYDLLVVGREQEKVLFEGDCMTPFDGKIKMADYFEDISVAYTIMECAWDYTKKSFNPIRFRFDKPNLNPQFIDVAIDIWEDIHNPITIETMKGNTLILLRKYHNKVKSQMLDKYINKDSTNIDIGSGRGGDLAKWKKLNLSVYAIEPNDENSSEFERRLSCIDYDGLKDLIKVGAEETSKLKSKISSKVDNVISFFSLTYFFKDEKTLDGLVNTISSFLKVGGKFIGILFDGEEVSSLLDQHNGRVNTDSYSIIRLSRKSSEESNKFGEKIEIDLKDDMTSLEARKTMVKKQLEYLTNFDVLTEKLASRGIMLIENYLLDKTPENLPHDSVVFSALNRAFIFERKTTTPVAVIPKELTPIIKKSSAEKKQLQKRYEVPNMLDIDKVKTYSIPVLKEKEFKTVRIGTVGEGSCLFHSILRGFSTSYKNMSTKERMEYVSKLREGFAATLSLEDFKKMGNGVTFTVLMDTYRDKILEKKVPKEKLEYALLAIYKRALRNCSTWAGGDALPTESLIEYIGKELNIDIFVISSLTKDIVKANESLRKTKAVVILNLDDIHFETIGLEVNEKVYTYFTFTSPIIQILYKRTEFS